MRSSHNSEQSFSDASQVVIRLSYCHDLRSSTKSSKHKLLSNVSFTDVRPPEGFPVVEVESVVFVLNYYSNGNCLERGERFSSPTSKSGLNMLAEYVNCRLRTSNGPNNT